MDRVLSACGDAAVFAHRDASCFLFLLVHSKSAESVWLQLQSDRRPYLMSFWYRPPAPGDCTGIYMLQAEHDHLSHLAIGTILVGDLNVHHKPGLRHSACPTAQENALLQFCDTYGFEKHVGLPTRSPNLLDLVLSDLDSFVSTKAFPKVADRKLVLITIAFSVSRLKTVPRELWV